MLHCLKQKDCQGPYWLFRLNIIGGECMYKKHNTWKRKLASAMQFDAVWSPDESSLRPHALLNSTSLFSLLSNSKSSQVSHAEPTDNETNVIVARYRTRATLTPKCPQLPRSICVQHVETVKQSGPWNSLGTWAHAEDRDWNIQAHETV